jgi:hypothetical protein
MAGANGNKKEVAGGQWLVISAMRAPGCGISLTTSH